MDLEFETIFYLNILADHMVFIKKKLAYFETKYINNAKELKVAAEDILNAIKNGEQVTKDELINFTLAIQALKHSIIEQQVGGKIAISLSVASLNEMLDEADEFYSILTGELNKLNPISMNNSLHHHKLWTNNSAAHCAGIMAELDPGEKDLKKTAKKFEREYKQLHDKAHEFCGILRSGLTKFPALTSLDLMALNETKVFAQWLLQLNELRLTNSALGALMPLMIDHFYREECYYMYKLTNLNEFKEAAIKRDQRTVEKKSDQA
jgi:hypothetical protein